MPCRQDRNAAVAGLRPVQEKNAEHKAWGFHRNLNRRRDAIGLAAHAAMGPAKGIGATGSPTVTGVMTATFGGILRDLLAEEPSVLLRPEIYVTAAMAGAAAFTLASLAGLGVWIAAMVAFAVAFAVRGGALHYGWTFPRYKARSGLEPDKMFWGDEK